MLYSVDANHTMLKVHTFHYRFFLPGWTTLTWSTLNIDAFLHQAEASVHLLRTTVDQSNSIVTDRVYPVFDNISNTILIDKTIITSRPWVIHN